MKVLITGGAGFIGSQLGKHLHQQGNEIILLDNLRFGHVENMLIDGRAFASFACRDVRDKGLGSLFDGVDIVFHLAGVASLPVCQSDPGEAYEINTAAVANILELSRRAGVKRVIFSSTSAVYENTKADRFREDAMIAPDLVYACTKAAAEEICDAFARNTGMDIAVCRFFNIYGPHQDVTRTSPPFTSYVARELVMDRVPVLFNESSARRDYVHSDDVIELLTRIMGADGRFAADRINVCSGVGHSVPELYELFRLASGKEIAAEYRDPGQYWDAYPALFSAHFPLSRERVTAEVYKNSIGDPARTRDRFGWCPRTDLRQGINAVYKDAERRLQSAITR
ncbi:MAG: NAD-dependent epimerase/dehydratase family protein [Sphingomonadaceae bacterium]|nr:NAD-dependent epimerase/dehydratase family protein [Sphingomonadaceae bacterium]